MSKTLKRFATITVSLDKDADPPVILSSRDENVKNRRVQWVRTEDTFDFVSLVFEPNGVGEFPGKKVRNDLITVRNKDRTGTYEYTITVLANDNDEEYTTTEDDDTGGDKPVIRN